MNKEMQKICELLNIEVVPEERNYWLIRTSSGKYFDDFLFNHYVSIGWDEFSNKDDFFCTDEKILKEQISKKYPNEKRPGYTYNQIKRFMFEIKKGDMILIPSENSSQIAFGIVTKDFYVRNTADIKDNPQSPKCKYKKCIMVEWKARISKNSFDPYLKMLMFAHSTVSDINEYKEYINRILYPLYICEQKLHIIFKVNSPENIPLLQLNSFFTSANTYTQSFGKYINAPVDFNELNVKVNVQSPGPIDIFGDIYNGISNNWGTILILALLLHYGIGGNIKFKHTSKETTFEGGTDGLLEKIFKFKKEDNEQKNTENILKLEEEKQYNEQENIKSILDLEKEKQKFYQYMESLKITNPATLETMDISTNTNNTANEDISDKEN